MNITKPLISVVVPVYRIEDYIEKCIDSIREQSFTQWELILVEDGSPDGCGAICDRYKDMDNRIRVIHKKNEGLLKARMDGTSAARAEYITFVDGDDYILPDRLKTMWEATKDTGAEMIATSFVNRLDDGSFKYPADMPFDGFYNRKMMTDVINEFIIENSISGTLFVYTWAKLYKKDLLLRVFNTINPQISIGEDSVTVLCALSMTDSLYVMNDDHSYVYNIREGSMCRSIHSNLLTEYGYKIKGLCDIPLSQKNSSIRDRYLHSLIFKELCVYIVKKCAYSDGNPIKIASSTRNDILDNPVFCKCFHAFRNHPINSRVILFYWLLVRKLDIACALLIILKRIKDSRYIRKKA